MSEATLSQVKAANPDAYEQVRNLVAASTGEDVSAIGDGRILQWLIANGPSIMAFIMQIIAVFPKQPTPVTPVTPPSPVG
jgi:hypothetical protein